MPVRDSIAEAGAAARASSPWPARRTKAASVIHVWCVMRSILGQGVPAFGIEVVQGRRVDGEAQPLAGGDGFPAAEQRGGVPLAAAFGGGIVTEANDPLVAVLLDGIRHDFDARPMARRAAIEREVAGPQP